MTEENRKKLESYTAAADGISRIFGSCCDVRIYSLDGGTQALVYEDSSADSARQDEPLLTGSEIELVKKAEHTPENCIGPYISGSTSGKQFRSVLIIIRNDGGELIGCIRIRFDISAPLNQFMKILMTPERGAEDKSAGESYPDKVENLVHAAFLKVLKETSEATGIAPIEKNKSIIQRLQEQGIFDIKGAVDIVAAELGVSKYTIYNYIRDVKIRTENSEERR